MFRSLIFLLIYPFAVAFAFVLCYKWYIQNRENEPNVKINSEDGVYSCPHCGETFEVVGRAIDGVRIGKDLKDVPLFCPTCRMPLKDELYGPVFSAYRCKECGSIVKIPSGKTPTCCPFCGKEDVEWRNISIRKPKNLNVETEVV